MQKTARLYPWRITAVIISLFFLCPSASFSSWKIAGQLPVPIGCCYFLNANQGLVGSGFYSTPTPIAIYITNDGGSTWTLAGTPPATGQVTQIAIRPDGTGYASIFSRNNPATNLWKTTDGGYSWKDVSSGSHYGSGFGVRSTGVFSAHWSAPVSPGANSNGVFVMDDADVLITNGPNTGTTGEAWGAYGDSSRHIWYIVAELSRQLLISTDRGVTWKPRFNFGAMMSGGNIPTGEIYGFDDALYVQTEVDGIFKGSMSDTGATWHRIGGPSNVADTRTIYASGCAGQNIIAFDRTGTYWKSEDGGDGTGSTASLKIQHINFQSISTCTNATKKATLTNKGCLPFVISNVSLLNNAAGAFTLLPPIKIPDTLAVGATDTFTVTFDARHIAGSYKAQIRVQGYFEAAFGTAQVGVDSNINLAGSATVEAPKVQISVQEIDFGDVSICANARDSIIRITNQGCDSLEFVSGPSGVDSAFILSNTIFPFILPPDSTLVVDVRFKPFIVGPVASYLVYRIATDGGTTDLKFHIEGNGIPGEGILFYPFQSFDFDTISICALDSVAAFMTNIGCGPLYIDHWTASGPFYLTGDGSLAPGVTIQPGDTIFFRFHPGYAHSSLYKGIDSGRFFVNVTGGSVPNDLLITFKGYIGDGSRVLNASLQKIDFGTTSLCDQKDTGIVLRNTGCDTLTVNDAHISGTGFTISGATFPLIIPPDSIIPIDIFTALDTAGGKLLVEDSLILLSNSDTTFLPIRLSHAYFPHREVGMFLDPTPKA
ncbi:MAG: choice-of-anchor D domain-containing protein, partial [Bacteroidota bacterium]|nr:choice-of-anchor D domain-containing protein [Bacteroidota bacterium]